VLRKLNNAQGVDEVHIEFDVLSITEEGLNQLKRKASLIAARIEVEERRYKELQQNYFELKKYLEAVYKIKKKLEEAKQAGEVEVNKNKNYRSYIMREH